MPPQNNRVPRVYMTEWFEEPCPFQLKETENGLYYQGVGTGDKYEEIQAAEIIEAFDKIALNENIKGIRICYSRIIGDLSIGDTKNLERFDEENITYINLPNVLIFMNAIFHGDVNFNETQFGEITVFTDVRFEGRTEFIRTQFKDGYFYSVKFGEGTLFNDTQFDGITNFEYSQFGETTYFHSAQFGSTTFFRSVQFGKITSFGQAQFGGETDFSFTRFGWMADFLLAQFGERTDFSLAQFGKIADFRYVQFKHPAIFDNVKYWSDSPRVTVARKLWKDKLLFSINLKNQDYFLDSRSISKDLYCAFEKNKVSLSNNFTIRVEEGGSKWTINTEANWEYHIRKEKGKLNIYGDGWWNKNIRRFLLLRDSPGGKPPGLVETYSEHSPKFEGTSFSLDSQNIDEVSNPYFKRYVADQQYIKSIQRNHLVIHWLWRWSSNCGRSISLWAFWVFIIAFLFSCAYSHHYWIFGIISLAIGCIYLGYNIRKKKWLRLILWGFFSVIVVLLFVFAYTPYFSWWSDFWQNHGVEFQQMANKYKDKPLNFWSSFYFSIVTFTTLGFGDVVANSTFARLLVTAEVILGYIMLGGLISIFANRLARRS